MCERYAVIVEDLTNKNERQKLIVCRDVGDVKYTAENSGQHKVRQYKVDGYIFDDDLEKCDFLLLNDTNKDAYMVELKGSDINKAIKQVETTYRDLKHNFMDYADFYRIIYKTGTQSVRSQRVNRWIESKGKKAGRKRAILKEKQYTEVIS